MNLAFPMAYPLYQAKLFENLENLAIIPRYLYWSAYITKLFIINNGAYPSRENEK